MQVKIGIEWQYLGPSAGVSELLHSKRCALPLSAALLAWLLACASVFWNGLGQNHPYKSDYTAFNIKPATTNIFWLFQRPAITHQITAPIKK